MHIVTETHYEYNDETYSSPDAPGGEEPGVPVAYFDNAAAAQSDRWERELAKWRELNGDKREGIAGYVRDIADLEEWSGMSSNRLIQINDKKRKYGAIVGVDPLEVKFGYDFTFPSDISDEKLREVVELFEGPHFFNVFELS